MNDTEKDAIKNIIEGAEAEVFSVSDGHVFVFSKEKIEELLRRANASDNIHKKVVIFVKHRTEGDIN